MKKILVSLMLSALAVGASADAKVLPGSNCSAMYGSQAASLNKVNSGVIENVGSSTIQVICPLITDVTDETAINSSYIYVRPSQTETLQCNAFAVSSSGAEGSSGAVATAGATIKKMVFSNNVANGSKYSRYFMTCNLSPGAQVIQYYYKE